ncbi:hypothetical protein COLO4_21608 [Corchorus olitorius]|uniref:Uncharacterized protein n=1 Tax=Corchorus olitorius TaxID=93759 RepID=A0A1R3ISB4_9ROSI|nr:hypothetical protein COLO4_21608 [Corchorus olitorius]
MITRSNLAEQLREYQIRSKHDWASVSFFSSTANITSSRWSNPELTLDFDKLLLSPYNARCWKKTAWGWGGWESASSDL